jgi:hypothetical protein
VRRGGADPAPESSRLATPLTRGCLTVQGALHVIVGLALLVAPGPMAEGWPWPVTPLLAQIYSAPLLAYGIGSLLLARLRTELEVRNILIAIGLFALLALIASLLHRDLFSVGDPAAWAWFGGLLVVILASVLTMLSFRRAA